jgi:hypothetical protein
MASAWRRAFEAIRRAAATLRRRPAEPRTQIVREEFWREVRDGEREAAARSAPRPAPR